MGRGSRSGFAVCKMVRFAGTSGEHFGISFLSIPGITHEDFDWDVRRQRYGSGPARWTIRFNIQNACVHKSHRGNPKATAVAAVRIDRGLEGHTVQKDISWIQRARALQRMLYHSLRDSVQAAQTPTGQYEKAYRFGTRRDRTFVATICG
jgi:hypothetical protein